MMKILLWMVLLVRERRAVPGWCGAARGAAGRAGCAGLRAAGSCRACGATAWVFAWPGLNPLFFILFPFAGGPGGGAPWSPHFWKVIHRHECGVILDGGNGPKGGARLVRGGSWNNEPRRVRGAARNRNEPRERNNNLGFRLASPPTESQSRGVHGCHGRGVWVSMSPFPGLAGMGAPNSTVMER